MGRLYDVRVTMVAMGASIAGVRNTPNTDDARHQLDPARVAAQPCGGNKLIRIVALLVACIVPLPGQQPPPFGVPCNSSVDLPPIVASEGAAELAGNVVIKCQGGSPTPAGQAIPQVTLRAYTNVNVTSRLLMTSPDLSEALLLIDDPAPQIQLVCPKVPCSISGTGGGVGADSTSPYNGASGHYNVFQATQIGGNVIEWAGVPLDAAGPGRVRTLRITNVRANLNQLGNGICLLPCEQFVMFVTTVGPTPISITNPQNVLGFIQTGLRFTVSTAVFPSFTPHNAAGPVTDFTMTFAEGFATMFKPRTAAMRPDDTSANANQNIPGKAFATASGFYNASFSGTYAGAGLATQGTRLMAHFESVPFGVGLFVTERPTVASSTLRVQLVSTGPEGDGRYDPVPDSANGFAPVTVYNGSAIAVWEVLAASPTDLESVEFGVAVSFMPDPSNLVAQTGTATVRGSVAPLSGVRIASLTDPVPRFMENIARPAFTITDRGTPVVSAVVNNANYASGAPLAPGSVAAIFGTYLTLKADANRSGPVATLGGTTVKINGIAAPIYATTPAQVNVEIPWELAGLSEASLKVMVDGQESVPVTIKIADTAPYIFIFGGNALIARQQPVQPGSLLTIYGTGFGPVHNQPATGSPATDLTSTTLNTPTVTIGGVPAEVTFSGLAPGLAGVCEVSVKLPDGVIFGPAVPVKLSIGGIDANPVAISLP
jgi:uncharacterized protein (TIGR03437 family)